LSLPDVNLSRNVAQARHAVASANAGEKASAASWTFITAVRLKVEQIQLVSAAWHVDLGCIGLQGA
jgi:hypothetical protein